MTSSEQKPRRGQPDCAACQALCCISHKIPNDDGDVFKEAGVICQHLDCESGNCSIYNKRKEEGLGVCEGYNCLGIGELITKWIENNLPDFDRRKQPTTTDVRELEKWGFKAELVDRLFNVGMNVQRKIVSILEENAGAVSNPRGNAQIAELQNLYILYLTAASKISDPDKTSKEDGDEFFELDDKILRLLTLKK